MEDSQMNAVRACVIKKIYFKLGDCLSETNIYVLSDAHVLKNNASDGGKSGNFLLPRRPF